MKMTKRLLSLMLAVIMAAGMMSAAPLHAAEPEAAEVVAGTHIPLAAEPEALAPGGEPAEPMDAIAFTSQPDSMALHPNYSKEVRADINFEPYYTWNGNRKRYKVEFVKTDGSQSISGYYSDEGYVYKSFGYHADYLGTWQIRAYYTETEYIESATFRLTRASLFFTTAPDSVALHPNYSKEVRADINFEPYYTWNGNRKRYKVEFVKTDGSQSISGYYSDEGYVYKSFGYHADYLGTWRIRAYYTETEYISSNPFTLYHPTYTFNISFNADGGTGSMSPASITPGDYYTLPECGFTPPAGKRFYAWYIESGVKVTYGQKLFFPGAEVKPTDNVTVKARWQNIPPEPVPCTLRFAPNGGSGSSFIRTANKGERYTLPQNPFTAPTHQVFYKWLAYWTDDDGVQHSEYYSAGSTITVPGDMTLHAYWLEAQKYLVYFHLYGEQVTQQYVYAGETVPRPADPVREGYYFDNWYISSSSSTPYDFSAPVNKITHIYAKWHTPASAPKWRVTLSAGEGGNGLTEQTVVKGELYTLPTFEWADSYSYHFHGYGTQFSGWDLGEPGEAIEITGDTTVTAIWAPFPEVVMTEDSAPLTGANLTVDVEAMAAQSRLFAAALEAGKVRFRWIIAGVEDREQTGSSLFLKSAYSHYSVRVIVIYGFHDYGLDDTTLYSETFNIRPSICTVSFDTGGGTEIDDQLVLNGETAERPADPIREGYEFLGWIADLWSEADFDFSTPITDNTTIYARWKDVNAYTITLAPMEHGTATLSAGSAAPGEIVYVYPEPEPGYEVDELKWMFGAAAEGSFNEESGFKMPYGNVVVYVTFKPLPDGIYSVTLRTDGNGTLTADRKTAEWGEIVNVTITPNEGYMLERIESITASGRTFNYTHFVDSGKWLRVDMPDEHVEVYASFRLKVYSVIFETNGGSDVEEQRIYHGESAARPDDPVREGWDFVGWYTDEALTTEYDFSQVLTEGDITLYAKWSLHSHDVVHIPAAEPSCTENGNTEYYACTLCGRWFRDEACTEEITDRGSVVIPAAHTPGEAVRENEVPATYASEGSYDEVIYCVICHEELSRETKTIEKLTLGKLTLALPAAEEGEAPIEFEVHKILRWKGMDHEATGEPTEDGYDSTDTGSALVALSDGELIPYSEDTANAVLALLKDMEFYIYTDKGEQLLQSEIGGREIKLLRSDAGGVNPVLQISVEELDGKVHIDVQALGPGFIKLSIDGKEYAFVTPGDVNLDGKMNAIDWISIMRWTLQASTEEDAKPSDSAFKIKLNDKTYNLWVLLADMTSPETKDTAVKEEWSKFVNAVDWITIMKLTLQAWTV
ncbi:MAG: InlB B-repeat-containing protein [Clostridia bacterium]|nr:InlB B-repeat-containing protein [Clostridia bacterium]